MKPTKMLTTRNNSASNKAVKQHAFYRQLIRKLVLFKVLAVLLFMTVSSNTYAQCTNFTQAQNWTQRLWCGTGDSSCSTREYAIYDGKVWTPNYSSTLAPLNNSSNRGYGSTTYWGYAAECEVAPPPPNHYRIEHDGQGVTGVSETVILKACADTNCSSVSTQTTSITLSPSVWGGSNSINITNGSNIVTLSASSAGTITFGKTTASPNVQLRCFVGNTETCNFVVSDGGGGSCPADSYGIYGLEEIEVKKPFIFNGVTVPKQTTPSNRAIDLNGNIVTPSPAIVLPTLPAITFVNSPDANGSLSPGNYGEWTVNEGAAVTMAPGIYNIDEVDIKDDAIITISPAGPVIINVNKFDMDDGSRLNANAGASAANLTVNYYGISSNNDNKFDLHKDVHFTGIIFSSYDDDKVEVKKDVILKGGIFTAGEVKLEDDTIVTYSAAEQAAAAVVLGCTTVTFDEPEMIAGRVTLKNTNTTAEFSEVCFDQPFSVTPLVFTMPTNDESAPNVIRIKNVTTTGFEIAQVQSQGTNSGSVPATIDFVAIVPGQYNLEGGARMDVVSFNTNTFQGKRFPGNQRGYDDVNFSSSFSSAPAIIAAIQTMNNESGTPPGAASMPFLSTAIRNVGTTDFDFALERVESLSGTLTNSEQVGYIAIDAGKTGQLIPGINYQSILTPDQITHSCRTYAISISPGGLPLVVGSQNRRDGGDGSWLQRCSLSNTSVGVKVDEDIDQNAERSNTHESAGILALSGAFTDFTDSCVVSPVAEWRFDGASWAGGSATDVLDSSGNALHGVSINTQPASGLVCNAANFTGSNYIEVANNTLLEVGKNNADYTVNLWLKLDATQATGWRNITQKGTQYERTFAAWLNPGGDNRIHHRASTSASWNDGHDGVIAVGSDWTMVTLVKEGSVLKTYLNGTLDQSSTLGGDTVHNTAPLRIGKNPWSDGINGLMDEFMVFDSALSTVQIQSIRTNHLASNNWDGSERSCPASAIDYYVITHSGSGVSCDPYAVSVSAVDPSGNAIDIPTGTELTLSTDIANDGWSNPGGIGATYILPGIASNVNFGLRRLTPGTLEIDVVDTSGVTDDDGDRNDDIVVFSDAGFVFYGNGVSANIGTQLSGKTSDIAPGNQLITVKAVQSSPSDPGVCDALISNASADIGVAYQCNAPNSCASPNDALIINSTSVDASSVTPYTPVPLAFNAAGESTFTLNYADAGSISLLADANVVVLDAAGTSVGTANVQGGSNAFLVKPAGLCVQVTESGNGCASGNASCSVFKAAGTVFNLEVSGRAWVSNSETDTEYCNNTITKNFVHSGIALSSNLVAPSSGANAALSVAATATDATGTVSQPINVNEVGVFTFTATPPAYFAEAITASTSANVGRFVPAYFELAGGSVTAANTSTASFTYLGQAVLLNYSLTAKSALTPTTTTENYEGSFAKLNLDNVSNNLAGVSAAASAQDVAYGMVQSTSLASYNARVVATGPGAATAWNDGVINVIGLPLTVQRGSNLEGPIANIDVGVLVMDSDSVTFPLLNLNTSGFGGSDTLTLAPLPGNLYYGRAFIPPAYGPEIPAGSSLDMPFFVQYFNGARFVTNTDDSSSAYNLWTASCADADVNDGLLCNEASVSMPGANFMGGKNDPISPMTIARPGLNNTGSLNITVAVDDWLRFDWDNTSSGDENPVSLVTFGTYRGNDRIIYWGESHSP